jgi:hypothetical protein
MAESLSITDQNFSGTFANTMIVRTTLDMDTVEKGCIYVIDGIKKYYSIPRLDVTSFVQARMATPVSAGQILVDRTVLKPQDYMVYLEFNPRDYETHWFSYQLNKNLLDETLPETAESFTVYQLLRRLGEWNERALWRSRLVFNPENPNYVTAASVGQLATDQQYQYFDGLMVKMLADNTVLQVAGAVTITATYSGTNGFYPFEQCLNLVPEALLFKYGKEGVKFHINASTQLAYESFLTFQMQYKNNDATERSINRYRGYEVVVCKGIPSNSVICCISRPDIDSNLFLGLNSTDDENNIQLQKVQNNSELYFIKLLLKADPSQGYGDQLVLYTTLTGTTL